MGDLREGRRPNRLRKAHLDEQLARLQRRREHRDEELVRGDPAAVRHELGPERERAHRQLRRRVGVRERAADGAAAARRGVTDMTERVPQQREGVLGVLQVPLPRHRADDESPFLGADPRQAMHEDLVRFKSLLEDGKTTVRGRTVRS